MNVFCPNCQHQEIEGAFYCSECATKLITDDGLSTATIKRNSENFINAITNKIKTPKLPKESPLINLHIVKNGHILPLIGRDNFSIGRISEGQTIIPDVDLSPFEAFSQGVSRLHATIKINNDQIFITDLESSNGTWVNKNKIPAHKYTIITNGDIITLGKFKIQAIIQHS